MGRALTCAGGTRDPDPSGTPTWTRRGAWGDSVLGLWPKGIPIPQRQPQPRLQPLVTAPHNPPPFQANPYPSTSTCCALMVPPCPSHVRSCTPPHPSLHGWQVGLTPKGQLYIVEGFEKEALLPNVPTTVSMALTELDALTEMERLVVQHAAVVGIYVPMQLLEGLMLYQGTPKMPLSIFKPVKCPDVGLFPVPSARGCPVAPPQMGFPSSGRS